MTEVSLMTCSPGGEIYSLYGHTALRVTDAELGLDAVFNYGIFSFKTPNFGWRFALGQTDYEVRALPYDYFMVDYRERGSSVTQQVLNLTEQESALLVCRLLENVQPENRTYRYNYLTNNCTTKVRDMVCGVIEGRVRTPQADGTVTYRQLMHAYTGAHPWMELGNDIFLGADCDTALCDEARLFLPQELQGAWAGAVVVSPDGTERPLVSRTEVVLEARPQAAEARGFAPLHAGLLTVLLCVCACAYEYKMRRMLWGLDAALMAVVGLVGAFVTFMFLCSEHPTLQTNWQVWVLNPLPLLCMPWVLMRAKRGRTCLYHPACVVVLTLFIAASAFLRQDFCEISVPLALCLMLRSLSYCISYRRR